MSERKSVPPSIDLEELRKDRRIAYYFRYPLHRKDFHPLRSDDHLIGYYAAKPLYGQLTEEGQVDRSSGYNGQIAVIFIPSPARSTKHARLILGDMPPEKVTRPNGQRNWPEIRAAAERAILHELELEAD